MQEKKYCDKKRAKSKIELEQSSSKYPSNKSSRIPDILAHIEYKYTHYDEWINFYLDEKKQSERIEGEPVYDSRKWRFKKHQGQRRFFTEVANKLTEFDIIVYGDLACAASHPNYRAKVFKGPIRRLYQFLVRDPSKNGRLPDELDPI